MEKEPLKEQSKFKNQHYSRRVSEDNENKPYKIICSKKIWKSHNKKALCWAIYYGDDNKDVDVCCPQTIQCIFCYNNLILICNLKMATITYYHFGPFEVINTIGQIFTKTIITKLLRKYI